jgi:hypothetical protein
MARDLIEGMLAKAKALRRLADSIETNARQLESMDTLSEPTRTADAWNVADDIRIILEDGGKTMLRDDLIRALVDGDKVKGETRAIKIAAARRAITVGKNKEYLRIDGETVHWIPGIYENPRLGKIL